MLGVSDVDIVQAFLLIIGFAVAAFAACFYLIARGTGIRD
jgi:hypothetical protein